MESGLKRTLGLPMLTFYGTGMILGAGIYSIIGKAAGETGEGLWLAFLLAGFAALLTGFAYAELSTMYPKAGAEFVYLREAFAKRPWLGATAGAVMAFSGAATASAVSLAFSGYLDQFIKSSEGLVSASLLILFTGVAIWGIRESGWANIVFTLIEMSGLALVIYLGLNSEKFGEALAAVPHKGTLAGAALIIFSFFGFENIVNLAEEAKEPEKKLPWAIFLSLGISLVLYILVSLAAVALLPPAELAESNAALMSVAKNSSAKIASILGGIALFSTANTALISMVGASRILYGMSEAKALPPILARTLPKRKTPWISSLLVLLFALMLLPLADIQIVASVSSLTTMLAFFAVNVTLIFLRYSHPDKKRPFRVPLSIGRLPIIPVVGALVSLLFIFQFTGKVYWIGGAFVLITLICFYVWEATHSKK